MHEEQESDAASVSSSGSARGKRSSSSRREAEQEAKAGLSAAARTRKRERRDPHRDRAFSRLGLAPGDRGVPLAVAGRWGRGGNENSVIRACELHVCKTLNAALSCRKRFRP
eukprot:360033-Prymnesium_polylepis.1